MQTVFPKELPEEVLRLLDTVKQLKQFQSLPVETQKKIQLRQLRVLLQYARRSSFWKQKLAQAGFANEGPISPSALFQLPRLTRQELQEKFEALRTYEVGKADDQVIVDKTSGSTGQPVAVERYKTLYGRLYDAALMLDLEWHGHDLSQTFGHYRHACQDSNAVGHSYPWSLYGGKGVGYSRKIGDKTIEELYTVLVEKRPQILSGSPTLIKLFCEMALAEPAKAPKVKTILTLGEVVNDELRVLAKQTMGARIVDRYSCGEIGWLGLQCPIHDHYHVLNSHVLLEIVDEDGHPCPANVPGQVLVTSLHSYAMPIIRYELGDVAQWGEPCDCGIKLPVISHVLGKTRDYVTLPNGTRNFVTLGGNFGNDVEGLRERQVRFYEGGAIEFVYRANHELVPEQKGALSQELQKRFGYPWPVSFQRVDHIQWESVWKRREFMKLPGLPRREKTSAPAHG